MRNIIDGQYFIAWWRSYIFMSPKSILFRLKWTVSERDVLKMESEVNGHELSKILRVDRKDKDL